MTNRTKWLIAIPFTVLVGFVVPAIAAGRFLWFLGNWGDTAFVTLTAGMWLAATAFVDVSRSRERGDRPRLLLTVGLILCVPVAVFDGKRGLGDILPEGIRIVGLVLCAVAAFVGLSARFHLGRFYVPQPSIEKDHELITDGPYRWIRHPMYAAALLWCLGWPLLVRSVAGTALAVGSALPALVTRMDMEEQMLLEALGEEYEAYQRRSRRLIPFLY